MENNFMLTDELLWEYADGFLEGAEKLRVDAYLQQHPEQKNRLEAILNEKRVFAALRMETPGPDFSRQVMAAWNVEQKSAKVSVKVKDNDWVLWGLAAGFALIVLAPFLLSTGTTATEYTLQIPKQYIPQIELPYFDWNGFFSSAFLRNFVLLLMGFMGLKLLDRFLNVRSHGLLGR